MKIADYRKEFYSGLEGEQRCKGIRLAIDSALEKQDIDNALHLYYLYCQEDTFNGDGYMSVVIFPEYLALFEKYPEYQTQHHYHLMWAYKWINETASEFHQVSYQQMTDILINYERLCKKFSYNLKTYYRTVWNVMYDNGIPCIEGIGSIRECHEKMLQYPRDDLSEIPSGECDDEVKYLLFVEKNVDKALKKAKLIFNGKLYCGEVPHYTYTNFACCYFENGDLTNAKLYADKAVRIIIEDYGYSNTMIYYKGKCLLVLAYTDLPKALKIFRKQYPEFLKHKNGEACFYFYLGSYHTMKQLEQQGQKTVNLKLPSDCEIYRKSGVYQISDMKRHLYDKANEIAQKFDERNRNSFFGDMLKKDCGQEQQR